MQRPKGRGTREPGRLAEASGTVAPTKKKKAGE
jgi:hypothetical protein